MKFGTSRGSKKEREKERGGGREGQGERPFEGHQRASKLAGGPETRRGRKKRERGGDGRRGERERDHLEAC